MTDKKIEILECKTHGFVEHTSYSLNGAWTSFCSRCEKEKEDRAAKQAEDEKQRAKQKELEKKQKVLEQRLLLSGISKRFDKASFDNYNVTTPESKAALEKCKEYAENFQKYFECGTSIILCGNVGTGKTHLASAIIKHVIKHHDNDAEIIKVSQILREIKSTYNKKSDLTEDQLYKSYKDIGLLVIDEIGVQFGTETEKNILFEIINERYEAMKPTILLSNLNIQALTGFVGERVVDRMKENGGKVILFGWNSHRGNNS